MQMRSTFFCCCCCCLGDGEGSILPDLEGLVVVVALVESVVGEIGIDPGNDLCK